MKYFALFLSEFLYNSGGQIINQPKVKPRYF